jgi:hypothetical protein
MSSLPAAVETLVKGLTCRQQFALHIINAHFGEVVVVRLVWNYVSGDRTFQCILVSVSVVRQELAAVLLAYGLQDVRRLVMRSSLKPSQVDFFPFCRATCSSAGPKPEPAGS